MVWYEDNSTAQSAKALSFGNLLPTLISTAVVFVDTAISIMVDLTRDM